MLANIIQKILSLQEKEQIISPIKQRILHLIGYLNLTKKDFQLKTGISRGTLESPTGITEDTITKVFASFPKLSPSWLFTGAGPMMLQSGNDLVEETKHPYSSCRGCMEKQKHILLLEKTISALERTIKSQEDLLQLLQRDSSQRASG
jgi:hypothetical protein